MPATRRTFLTVLLGSSFMMTPGKRPEKSKFTIDPDNRFTFTPGSDFDHLEMGETRTIEYVYTLADGSEIRTPPMVATIRVTKA